MAAAPSAVPNEIVPLVLPLMLPLIRGGGEVPLTLSVKMAVDTAMLVGGSYAVAFILRLGPKSLVDKIRRIKGDTSVLLLMVMVMALSAYSAPQARGVLQKPCRWRCNLNMGLM